MRTSEVCRYCGQTIIRAEDGAWEDPDGRSGCGQAPKDSQMEHEPASFARDLRVRWAEHPSHNVRVLTDEGPLVFIEDRSVIWDYDDDGLDEDGRPIMRPLYERHRVPREQLEALSVSTPKQVIVVRKDLGMRKGKMIAQGAHASMIWLTSAVRTGRIIELTAAERAWLDGSFTKVVVGVESEEELLEVASAAGHAGLLCHVVHDAGRTEFHGVVTKTCCAIGPDWSDRIDPICGALKLL